MKFVEFHGFSAAVSFRIHAVLILSESLAMRSSQAKLLRTLDDLEAFYFNKFQLNISFNQWRVRRFLIIELINLSIVLLSSTAASLQKGYFLHYLTTVVPSIYVNGIFYIQHLMITDFVGQCLELLNKCLQRISDEQTIDWNQPMLLWPKSMPDGQTSREKILWLKENYSRIWKASRMLNEVTKWSKSVGVFSEIGFLFMSSYCTVSIYLNGKFSNRLPIAIYVIWICISLLRIFTITAAGENMNFQVFASFQFATFVKAFDFMFLVSVKTNSYAATLFRTTPDGV